MAKKWEGTDLGKPVQFLDMELSWSPDQYVGLRPAKHMKQLLLSTGTETPKPLGDLVIQVFYTADMKSLPHYLSPNMNFTALSSKVYYIWP